MSAKVDPEELRRELTFGPSEKWWVGNVSLMNVVRGEINLPNRVTLMEQTIREGEDTPEVYFSTEARFELLEKMEEAGIKEAEVGYVGAIQDHFEFAKKVKERGLGIKIGSHNRAYTREEEWRLEIDRAVDAGCEIVTLVTFMTEPICSTTHWLKKEDVPERVAKCIEYSKAKGVYTCVIPVDAARTRLDLYTKCLQLSAEAGVDRVYVCDAFGNTPPEAFDFLVRYVRDVIGSKPQIALHCHNDLGLSMANALAGIRAGAECIDVTINGLGHNSGITPLEEIVCALKVLYGVDTGVDLKHIPILSKLVEKHSRLKVFPNKAIVGENVYRHQLDSHMASIIRGVWYSWDIIHPEVFGRKFRLEWVPGRLRIGKSGSVMAMIESLGMTVTNKEFCEISRRLRDQVYSKGVVTEKDLEAIIKEAK